MIFLVGNASSQWLLVLILILLGLVLLRLLRKYENRVQHGQKEQSDDLLVVFLTLIAFTLGIFSAVLLLSISP